MGFEVLALFAGLGLAYLIGALPIGVSIARARGIEPRRAAAYNLGPEGAVQLAGDVPLLALLVDLAKGALAMWVASLLVSPGMSMLVALAAYIGHIFPPQVWLPAPPSGGWPVRGRGYALLAGLLTGLVVFANIPFAVGLAVIALFAALLAVSGWIALAALVALTGFVVVLAFLPVGVLTQLAALVLLGVAVWRSKENIGRMLDLTEPRLGDPPPVNRVGDECVAAFIFHCFEPADIWKSRRTGWLKFFFDRGWLQERHLHLLAFWMRPVKVGELRGIRTLDGRSVRCYLIGTTLFPEHFKLNPELAKRRAIEGARLAAELGASVYGLGAFFGTVGKKGLEVQEAVPEIVVTNGGAYTAGTVRAAVPQILGHWLALGKDLKTLTAAVVGANGVVAFGMARMIATEVGRVILIGRDLERLERSRATLERAYPETKFVISIDAHDCREADLIFSATSDPNPVIFARDVKPGAWIYDEGRPADAHPSVLEGPDVRLIPGGVVLPPGGMVDAMGWARGYLGFGDGAIPACLAETLIIAITGAWERASLGETTKTENIQFFIDEAKRLGFRVIDELPIVPELVSK